MSSKSDYTSFVKALHIARRKISRLAGVGKPRGAIGKQPGDSYSDTLPLAPRRYGCEGN